MKQVLKAKQITIDIKDYFDEEKKLYEPYPVFPFLTEEAVKEGIKELINESLLREEVKTLADLSKSLKNTITDSNFIICLVKWNEYPELIKMLTVIREWAFRNDGGGVGSNDFDGSVFGFEFVI